MQIHHYAPVKYGGADISVVLVRFMQGEDMKKPSVIRNPKAYQRKLDKQQKLLDKMRSSVSENLTTVLAEEPGGKVTAKSRGAVAMVLIRGGVLGGSIKCRHVASVFKQHEQTGEPIGKFDWSACMDAIAIVKEALVALEATEELAISDGSAGVTVELATTPVLSLSKLIPFPEFSDEFGSDPYDRYDPRNCVRSGRAKVDSLIMND